MKKYHNILLILMFVITGCTKVSDQEPPIPDPIKSYFNIYNFLSEPYDVAWEIDDEVVEPVQTYGSPILEFSIMEKEVQDLMFTAKEAGADHVIKNIVHQAKQNHYYTVSLMGNETDPLILIEPMELKKPSMGQVKLRFMHTAMELGALDIYIGGSSPDHKALSNVRYALLTEYFEASQKNLWEAIIVTPNNVAPEDSTLLSFTANNIFLPNHIYMGVIGHTTSSPSSSLHLQLYNQPVN